MDRYVIKGIKKLRSLTRTKIRLAEEAGTVKTKPAPLPLVEFLSNKRISTVADAKERHEELGSEYGDAEKAAKDVLEMMDIIEGVKYDFEPKELMLNLTQADMKDIERRASRGSSDATLLLMSDDLGDGPNLYVGEDCPEGATFLSGVPTSLAGFLDFAFRSDYFWDGKRLKSIRVALGRKTLIMNAICFALGEFGAKGTSDAKSEGGSKR